jgi:hypothetical protein
MKLYKFLWDIPRGGSVSGVFLAEPEEVAKAIGKEIYFGEILGKHSEVYGTLEEGEVKALDVSEEFVEEFGKHFPNGFGHNPLNYLPEEE